MAEMVVEVPGVGPVPVRFERQGAGRPVLVLHGGAGPSSVTGLVSALAAEAEVVVPSHPGFDGTLRPEPLTTIAGLGATYAALLAALELEDVVVVGNSIGGWIAAELALTDATRLAGLVLVDAVGVEVPEHPVADFFALSLAEVADYSYFDPDAFRIDPAALPPERLAVMASNRATLAVFGGSAMADPGLRGRLSGIELPALVVWGAADRIATPAYGQAFADAIPGARFVLMERTGHLPQLESLPELLAVLRPFVAQAWVSSAAR